MLTLKEMVTKYLEDALYAHRGPAATQASLLHAHTPTRKMEEEDADVDHAKRLPLSEQSGFQRYICSATTGTVWLEGGFTLFFVAHSLTEFLGKQPGSRVKGNMQKGSRQKSRQAQGF